MSSLRAGGDARVHLLLDVVDDLRRRQRADVGRLVQRIADA